MIEALDEQSEGIIILIMGNPRGETQFRTAEKIFFEWFGRAKDNVTIEGEKQIIEEIEHSYTAFREQFYSFIKLSIPQSQNGKGAIFQESFKPLIEVTKKHCLSLLQLNEQAMYEASKRASSMTEIAIWSTAIVSSTALVIGLLFSLFLAGKITHPLSQFIQAARKLSSGDYTIKIPVETKDELGVLAKEFNQLAAELGRYHEMKIDQIILERNKISAILSSIADPIIVFDVKLNVTGINPAARKALNLDFVDYSSLHCSDIFPSTRVCKALEVMIQDGRQLEFMDDERVITIRSEGIEKFFLFSITSIRDKEGTLTGIVLMLKDITNFKELERLKNEFITAATHELKTPLTSIGMSIGMLKENALQFLPQKEQELLLTAYNEIQRMKELITDLLDYSRVESGKIKLQFEEVDPKVLFDFVQLTFKEQVKIKKAELLFEIPEQLPLVKIDTNKTVWVLSNLVSNALRYIDTGGIIKITVKTEDSYLLVSVHDTGPGIPDEYQQRIFHKYFQFDSKTPRGSGLGLAICKEILRALGGNIWVESKPGKGSTFHFTLPLSQKK